MKRSEDGLVGEGSCFVDDAVREEFLADCSVNTQSTRGIFAKGQHINEIIYLGVDRRRNL